MQKILLLVLCSSVLSASAQKIEGIVYDDEGKILPYASVLIKGTPQGVIANTHGNFSFALPTGNYTLVCMHVGYATQIREIECAVVRGAIGTDQTAAVECKYDRQILDCDIMNQLVVTALQES